jgi:formylglycine-generating enzyme required for sulfatase activity
MKAGKMETFTVYEKVFDIKGTQLVMVYISEGDWKQGSEPFHFNPFYMGKFPVTQRQYEVITGKNPSKFKGNGNLPVKNVSWLDAVEFCKKLSQLTGKTFRLPTEAEWEYAARAGTTTEYWWGDSMDNKHCWYGGNSGGKTRPVDEKVNEHTNLFGLCDILGNVWEWTHSDYVSSYGGSEVLCSENATKNKSLRGGSWFVNSDLCRVAYRNYDAPSNWLNSYGGFRVMFDLP